MLSQRVAFEGISPMNADAPAGQSAEDQSSQSKPSPAVADKNISAQRLKSFIQRIERLDEEKRTLSSDIREVYAEAKSGGFDPKIMRKVVALRRLDKAERQEMESLMQVYLDAIGE